MNDFHKTRFRDILFDYRRCGDIQKAVIDIAELSNEVWNDAIDAAVKVADDLSKRHYTDETIADEIRKLKK